MFSAAIVVYLEALFRAARLSPVVDEFDGWAFRVPKAQTIDYFGRLETEFLSLLPYSTGDISPVSLSCTRPFFTGLAERTS